LAAVPAPETARPPAEEPGPSTAPSGNLRARVVKGTALSLSGQALSQGLRFASNLLLSRLLFPEAFGLMALVQMVLAGLHMLSDLGVGISIIHSKRGDDPDFLDTAWTIQLVRGAALWVAGLLLAYPIGALYDAPVLTPMIALTTFVAVIQGAVSTKVYLLHRHIQIGRLLLLDLSSQALIAGVQIAGALVYPSPWVLVVGALSYASWQFFFGHFLLRGRNPRLRWEPAAAREVVNFGKWIFISTCVTYAATRVDIALLGRLAGKELLGIYNLALMLGTVPQSIGGQVLGSVLLPALATSFHEGHEALEAAFARSRRAILPLLFFVMLGIGLVGPPMFYYLWDARYHEACWMVRLVALSAWFHFLQEAVGRTLQAMGDARSLAVANAFKLGTSVVSIGVGFWGFGVPGFLVGTVLGAMAGYAVLLVRLRGHKLHAGRTDLLYSIAGILIAGGTALAARWAARTSGAAHEMAFALALSVSILLPVGIWVARRLQRELRR
jgi:O-antigen/teichoic acid export membrane protein